MNLALRTLILLLVSTCGCGDTGVAFRIVSEFPYGTMDGGMVEPMRALGVVVTDREDRAEPLENRTFSVPGEVSRFPAWVVVNRRSGDARGVRAEFRVCRSTLAGDGRTRGCRTDGPEVMLTYPITVSYIEGVVREINIELLPECVDVRCPVGETCVRGPRCVPEAYDDRDAAVARDVDPIEDQPLPVDLGDSVEVGADHDLDRPWPAEGGSPSDGSAVDRMEASETPVPMDAPPDRAVGLDAPPPDALVDLPVSDRNIDAPCPGMQQRCGTVCVDVTTTIAHCGRCGNACPTGANAAPVCASATCGLGCNVGYSDCDRVAANGCEANLSADARNCGACGRACATGQVCSGGACMLTCGARTNCGSACVDTQTDPRHCSRCDASCALPNVATHTCERGTCGIGACATGFANCDGLTANGCEVNVRGADLANCGGCGTRCAFPNASATCAMGTCRMGACAPGFGDCDGAPANGCEVALSTDPRHCGMCGRACAAINNTPACIGGSCQIGACAGTWRDCDVNAANGCEVNSASDVSHCGMCGRRCVPPPNMTATCATSACAYACGAGFANCDMNAANGCEANVAGDVRNCGRCGNVCPVPAGGSATCMAGTCGGACPAGLTLCGGMCVNVMTTVQHCGGCGRTCALPRAVPACAGGACRVSSCQVGWRDCDGSVANGCEVDVTTRTNCGACGRSCPAGQNCVAGACQVACPSPNQVCGGACVNVSSDVNHCGSCGNPCLAPSGGWSTCAGGTCSSGCFAGASDCGGICQATGASCSSGGSGGCQQGGSVVCQGTGTTCSSAMPRTTGACMVPAGGVCNASGDCVCPAGQTNCGGVCQSLSNDVNNCGACGNVCAARANSGVTCSGGACSYACIAGYYDCDGDPANGCELVSTRSSCGCPRSSCGIMSTCLFCPAHEAGYACADIVGRCPPPP